MGGFESDVNEDSNENLRILGDWDPKTQEKHHSTKLPNEDDFQREAGLLKGDSVDQNPGTACKVPEELRNDQMSSGNVQIHESCMQDTC